MPKQRKNLLGPEVRKVQPKLRMVANGDFGVNAIRAEHSACVCVASERLAKTVPTMRGEDADPIQSQRRQLIQKPGKLKQIRRDILANVFIGIAKDSEESTTTRARRKPKFLKEETARKENVIAATIPLSKLRKIAKNPSVSYIELGEPLKAPTPVTVESSASPPRTADRKVGSASRHSEGKGVLVGIIDVQGFDFAHPDFLDDQGKTRFERIWDQGGDFRKGPKRFGYGSEFTKKHLDEAIKTAKQVHVPAVSLEPQSQMAVGSHGTHVATSPCHTCARRGCSCVGGLPT